MSNQKSDGCLFQNDSICLHCSHSISSLWKCKSSFIKIGSADITPEDLGKLQNIRGVVFFLIASNAFGGIQGTLATFSTERPVFLR
jgi:hypothetical protein